MTTPANKQLPTIGTLDPLDWTTEEIVDHILQDTFRFREELHKAKQDKETDALVETIQSYRGKICSWLDLYGAVTKQEVFN